MNVVVDGYDVVVEEVNDEDGEWYFATVPSLPGCMSGGDSIEEMTVNIRDAIVVWLSSSP